MSTRQTKLLLTQGGNDRIPTFAGITTRGVSRLFTSPSTLNESIIKFFSIALIFLI